MSRQPAEWVTELKELGAAFSPLRARTGWLQRMRASQTLFRALRERIPPSEAFAFAAAIADVEPRQYVTIRGLVKHFRSVGCHVPVRTIYRAVASVGNGPIFFGSNDWDSCAFEGCLAKIRVIRNKGQRLRFEAEATYRSTPIGEKSHVGVW